MRWSFIFAICLAVSAASMAHGQVVHLPTFRTFSVRTSVMVPDRGRAYLGGSRIGATSRSRRGNPLVRGLPFANQNTVGRSLLAGGTQVSATIIDHHQWDQAVRSLAKSQRSGNRVTARDRVERKARFISRHVTRNRLANGSAKSQVQRR